MEDKKYTEISEVGRFALTERLVGDQDVKNPSTVHGGNGAAVIRGGDGEYTLLTAGLMLEGVDFDLTYFPLKHLGYKSVVRACSGILAMNGTPRQIIATAGISSRFSVEDMDELYNGIKAACKEYGIDLVGGEAAASAAGLVLSMSAAGSVGRESVVYRSGAKTNDLICITGDLGAAYMGLSLLEREKRVLKGHAEPKPEFGGYEYLLRRQLRPKARLDVIESLQKEGITPTSMTCIRDGLAADLLGICLKSDCGARIYLDRIPIASETYALAEELNADPVVAALNGGEDYEMLFTVRLEDHEAVSRIGGIEVIGHITGKEAGAALVTPDDSCIPLTAPGLV